MIAVMCVAVPITDSVSTIQSIRQQAYFFSSFGAIAALLRVQSSSCVGAGGYCGLVDDGDAWAYASRADREDDGELVAWRNDDHHLFGLDVGHVLVQRAVFVGRLAATKVVAGVVASCIGSHYHRRPHHHHHQHPLPPMTRR